MGSFKRSYGGCLCGLRINWVWMHSLLCLFLWFFTPAKQSDSMASSHIRNRAEKPEGSTLHPDSSSSTVSPSVSPMLQHLNCRYEEQDGLAIFCTNVDLIALAPNISSSTVHLEITESPLQTFSEPLLLHLRNVRYLKLSHNAHRYITSEAFQGLHKLKVLNLSFNDITTLNEAFVHTLNLEVLNLTWNQIIDIKPIATALNHLHNFCNLSLNHNVRISRILSDELLAFANTSLMKLELFNTSIQTIEQHAFRPLRHLKLLDLSLNYLDEVGLRNVTADLGETSIEILVLRNINIQNGLPYEALSYLGNTSVLSLDMSYNYFSRIPKFPRIPTLISLWLSFCSIQRIDPHAFSDLPNLELLELGSNRIFTLYKTIQNLPKLKYLYVKNQKLPEVDRVVMGFRDYVFIDLAELLLLDLRNIRTQGYITRYTFYGLRRLEELLLSNVQVYRIEDYSFETMSSLKQLDLSSNHLSRLTNYTFAGLSKLNNILLSKNAIKFTSGVYPFQNSPSLAFIALNFNEISEIPVNMFCGFPLLNILVLSSNKVVAWNSSFLFCESNISVLLLSQNEITYVTPTMIADFRRVNDTLDVTDNPFNCSDCGIKDFRQFITETETALSNQKTINVSGTYTCSFPQNLRGKSILEIEFSIKDCLSRGLNTAVFFATLMLSVIIPTILISVLCYVFRWYIRYSFFHLEAKLKARRHSKDDQKRYVYDAFVSYNASDTPWVINSLIPALEEKEPRFKLCIHERDFEVGRLITDNILYSIEVSRKVILLLSESFLMSEWCMLELHMAQHKLFDERRDVLVLVKLEHIDKKLYTKNLRYLEKTRPCLPWTDNPVGQKLFWDQMRKAVGKPSTDDQQFQYQKTSACFKTIVFDDDWKEVNSETLRLDTYSHQTNAKQP